MSNTSMHHGDNKKNSHHKFAFRVPSFIHSFAGFFYNFFHSHRVSLSHFTCYAYIHKKMARGISSLKLKCKKHIAFWIHHKLTARWRREAKKMLCFTYVLYNSKGIWIYAYIHKHRKSNLDIWAMCVALEME